MTNIKITVKGPRQSGRTSVAALIEAQLRPFFGQNVEVIDPHNKTPVYMHEAQNRIRALPKKPKVTIEVK